MEQFRLNGLASLTLQLFRRHGLGIYLDFLAAGVLLTTVIALADPEGLRARMAGSGEPDATAALIESVLLNPVSYLSSALYSLVMAAAFLRMWGAEHGPGVPRLVNPDQTLRQSLVMLVLLQAVADMLFTLTLLAGQLVLFVASGVLAALTMGILPATVLEARSWDAVGRSIQIAWPRLMVLSMVWFMIILPWLVAIVVFDPANTALADAGDLGVWFAALGSEIVAPVFSTLGLCFVAAAYRQTLDREAGGKGDVSDIFR